MGVVEEIPLSKEHLQIPCDSRSFTDHVEAKFDAHFLINQIADHRPKDAFVVSFLVACNMTFEDTGRLLGMSKNRVRETKYRFMREALTIRKFGYWFWKYHRRRVEGGCRFIDIGERYEEFRRYGKLV